MSKDSKSSYYDAGGIETLDIIKAKLTPEQYQGYLLGSALKYSCRMMHKSESSDGQSRDAEKLSNYSTWLSEVTDALKVSDIDTSDIDLGSLSYSQTYFEAQRDHTNQIYDESLLQPGGAVSTAESTPKTEVRYAAWHISEPGFLTATEVERWIAKQDDPEEYRVVATTPDFVLDSESEKVRLRDRRQDLRAAIDRAVEAERVRISKLLGLDTTDASS